jgi:hypothetical protein
MIQRVVLLAPFAVKRAVLAVLGGLVVLTVMAVLGKLSGNRYQHLQYCNGKVLDMIGGDLPSKIVPSILKSCMPIPPIPSSRYAFRPKIVTNQMSRGCC